MLLQVHGSSRHKGKQYSPSRAGTGLPQLRRELKMAIQKEDFERAAFLRDSICGLQGGDSV